MIYRRSAAAICHGGTVFSAFPLSPITSSYRARDIPSRQTREYASTHDGRTRVDESDHSPLQWPVTPNPTPYEIFDQAKGAPYSKMRFYELVKLYHPDRHRHTLDDGTPHLTKLERYRLVVAANSILSDPERRRLYDRYGAGWGGESEMHNRYRTADRTWRQEPGNASMNATWEDWEKWYQEQDGKKQEPLFVSNGGFVGIVVVLALIGGWGHISRAGRHSADLLDMRDQQHASISRQIQQRQNLYASLSKEARVQHFLKQREGWDCEVSRHDLVIEERKHRPIQN